MLGRAWKRRVSLRLVSFKLSKLFDGRFRSELPLDISAERQGARARLALVVDGLRKEGGHSVILRGHDFRLRSAPREALATPASTHKSRQIIVRAKTSYIPLRCHSYYSFLDSTLSPAAIVQL